jgi:hypothetical protein
MKIRIRLIVIIGLLIIVLAGILFQMFKRYTDTSKMSCGIATSTPDLIKQLCSASIPEYLDSDAKEFFSLKDGEIAVYGPQILMDGTIDKSLPQDVFHWSAYLNDDTKRHTIADFNNDGLDDVAIVIWQTGGGSGGFSNLTIFMNDNGNLKYLTSKEIGDRIEINKISYDSGLIIADIITQGPGEPLCCGTMPATLSFKLENSLLVPVLSN